MSLPNIDTVRLWASFSNAMIYINGKDGKYLWFKKQNFRAIINSSNEPFLKGSTVQIGPDATGVGWAYRICFKIKTKSLDELRTLQDYYYKFALLGVDGVSEIASIGGFVKIMKSH